MNTYKSYSYKGKDPIEVTVNNVNLHDVRDGFTEGFTCWVLVDKEIAFQVDYQGDDKLRLDGFSFGINHFDDKEDFNKFIFSKAELLRIFKRAPNSFFCSTGINLKLLNNRVIFPFFPK